MPLNSFSINPLANTAAPLARLQSVEHIGHIRELAHLARLDAQYAEAWMWHCLVMMFGYGVRAAKNSAQDEDTRFCEAIRRHDIAYKISMNEARRAREQAQYLFDAMGAKLRRRIARHNHLLMIQ